MKRKTRRQMEAQDRDKQLPAVADVDGMFVV